MQLKKSSLMLALLLGACTYQDDRAPSEPVPVPAEALTLTATPAVASPGSTMTLTLANGLAQAIGYNLCTSQLQTAAGAAVRTDRVCTMELRNLEPGRTTTYSYELPRTLSPGRYRFSTDVERMQTGSRTTLTSNMFEVR